IGGYHVWTPHQVFVDVAPDRPINWIPTRNAPLHVKQAFMESLTRDPMLVRDLPKEENDIDQFLDWILPLNGVCNRWDQNEITRFLLDFIACNFGSSKQPDAQAVLRLADQPCRDGHSLFL